MRSDRVRLSRCLAGVFCVGLSAVPFTYAGPQAAGSHTGRQDATNELSLVVGRSVLLDTAQPVQRVAVGVGDFAEAQVITPTEIMVNGKAIGETTLILWEAGGNREFFNVTVGPSQAGNRDKLEGLRRELRSDLSGQDVKVTQENGAVFLRGTVNDLTSSARAVQIAAASGVKVVNLLNVQVPAAKPQILLKVVFASVDRTKSRQLGLNLFSTGFGNVDGGVSTGQFSPPTVGPGGAISLANDLNLFAFLPGLNLGATVQALESKGLVQVLAEPNVLTEDGKQGSLLAGGEYPYPVVQGSAGSAPTVTIMFKEFGIRLNFLPTIMPNKNIRLQVAPEVSSLDFTNQITVSGFQVPAIDVRRVRSEIELSQGQSFAIGGLLDNRTTETLQKIPFIGNIPYIGKLFQSINRTKSNTELIVIVTPEIVLPVPAGSILPPTFAEQFMPPNSTAPMHHPDESAAATTVVPPATMPVEDLIQSMKPEPQLQDVGGYSVGSGSGGGGGGDSGGGGAGASAGASSTPQ